MKRRFLVLALLLAVIAGVVPLAAQGRDQHDEATATAPVTAASGTTGELLDFLGYVPNTASYRKYLTYGDKAAWLASWNVPNVPSLDILRTLNRQVNQRWMFILPRQTLPPNALALQYLATGDDLGTYGFDYFQTDRYLEAGQPPETVTVVDGQFDSARIDTALTAIGYSQSPLPDGGTLYSLRGDYEIDMRADLPMIGKLATRNRIALIGDRMLIASASANLQPALAAASGEVDSLSDAPEYQAAVDALNGAELADAGPLLGAIFTTEPVLSDVSALVGGRLTPEQLAALQSRFDRQPKLPPYVLSVFSSHHAGGKTSLVLTLVFSANTDAEAAARSLEERIRQYTSLRTQTPFLEALHAQFDRAFATEANGLPVAILVLMADDPGPDSTAVPDWSQAIFARDLGFLAVGP